MILFNVAIMHFTLRGVFATQLFYRLRRFILSSQRLDASCWEVWRLRTAPLHRNQL